MEANKTFNAPEVKLHFLDYWRIIRIRKTVIFAVFLLVAATTTLVTFMLPETYSSMVRIRVEKDALDLPGIGDQNRGAPGFDPFWVQDQFETIQSKAILYNVISNLSLTKKWAPKFKENELPLDLTFQVLQSQMDVRQSRNTSLIEIHAFSEDKKEAAVIANEIAKVYKDYRLNERRLMTKGGIDMLKRQWEDHNREVTNMQVRVDVLKAELGISDFEAMGGISSSGTTPEPEILRKLEGQRIEAQAEFKRIETLYNYLSKLERADLKKAVATASPDQQLTELMSQQALAEQKLADLIENVAPEHPDMKRIARVLAQINKQVDDRLDGIMKGLEARKNSEKAHLDALTEAADEFRKTDIERAIKRRPYWQAKRDLESLQMVRERLNLKIIQEEVDSTIPKTGIVSILDPAEVSLKPDRPRKALNIFLGVVIGLIVGVGLAFFIEYLDTSVKTIDDVERALQAPVLGVIPQNVGSLMDEGPDSPHAEAYRVLRTNLMFSQKDPKLNTMTIVSAGAGEGKSTTTFNLAVVFAQNGQRVLVVDSDLRRPSIHKLFKVSNSIGLTNYLLKQNTLEEVIQTTSISTLDFMPSGKLPSSSMGVLSSNPMKELIRELKRRYDWVFFDSPPIMGVSDASILASEVDMVLQVIQYRRYPQPMTIRAKQMIEKVGGNLLGIVLNNISMASDENYYYYSGYYYDYYSKQDDDAEAKPDSGKSGKPKAQEEAKVEIKPKY
ncbi:MAG TPA: polysaccharide biosynthesis tyrosine autokinase [Verrucomicrobiae bacterium]|nr:polysaccharide biosynthesis tyrosine autokinase [Verrucomicrobiae bacterium]